MKAPAFDYAAPRTVDETVTLLADRGDDSSVLAGGQSLVPLLALRLAHPELVIDINRVEGLSGIERADGHVRVGALVRHAALARPDAAAGDVPLLGLAAPHIGHFQIRSRGTLCGSIAHADASAEWPLVAVTLDALIELADSTGTHIVPAAEFFLGPFMTARKSHQLVVSAQFPVWSPRAGFAIEEFARRSGDFAIAGAACAVEVDGGKVSRCAIGLLGLSGVPVRASAAERELTGAAVADLDLAEIARIATVDVEPPADIHGTARYRRRVGAVVVATALTRALSEARDG